MMAKLCLEKTCMSLSLLYSYSFPNNPGQVFTCCKTIQASIRPTCPGNVLSPTQYSPLMLVVLKGMLNMPRGRLHSTGGQQRHALKVTKEQRARVFTSSTC